MRTVVFATPLLAAVLVCSHASAQSADDILNQLRPTASSLKGATRGIRPIGPVASSEPATAGEAAAAHARAPVQRVASSQPPAASRESAPSVNLQIEFKSGSSELTPAAMRSLDELGKALSNPQLAAFRFRIEGHTDTVGAPEANKALSDQRAKAVAAYLTGKFGVDAGKLEPIGMGEDDLAVATGPQVPEAKNRRVQVVNLGA